MGRSSRFALDLFDPERPDVGPNKFGTSIPRNRRVTWPMSAGMNVSELERSVLLNIARHGHHIQSFAAAPLPRMTYTIGLAADWGAELLLFGGLHYEANDIDPIFNELAVRLRAGASADGAFDLGAHGVFRLRKAHSSWAKLMLDGLPSQRGYQIVPDEAHHTIDIPDTAKPWSASTAPAWRWFRERWRFPVPPDTHVLTDLRTLRGDGVVHVYRGEDNYWEMSASCTADVTANLRYVPIGVLLGHDRSLRAAFDLEVGTGLGRDGHNAPWRVRTSDED